MFQTPNGNSSVLPEDKISKSERRYLELLQRRLRNSRQYNPKHIRVRNKVIAIKMKDTSILNSYITFEEVSRKPLNEKFFNFLAQICVSKKAKFILRDSFIHTS